MPLDDLPDSIKKHILCSVNGSEKEKEAYYRVKEREVHVTDLLYCLRKSYFKRMLQKPVTLRVAYNMYRGNELDKQWTPLFEDNQQRCTHRVAGIPFTIVGKFDFYDSNDECIGDLKTVKNLHYIVRDGPKQEHIDQLSFYAYENAFTKAKLIYMDYGECQKYDVPIDEVYCEELLARLEQKARILFFALQSKIPPTMEQAGIEGKEWLCGEGKDYQCEYFEECRGCLQAVAQPVTSTRKRKEKA